MRLDLELQVAVSGLELPSEADVRAWAEAVLASRREHAEVVVRLVDEAESAELNSHYRGKQGPTNVLSFPFQAPPPVQSDLLGDVVICAPVVAREAREQGKEERAHWAHMLVHGLLHLLGYDHQKNAQAVEMETMETGILAGLGFADPYETTGDT